MGADPRLPKMPDKPTLIDFFKHRFVSMNHLLQSATLALKAGHEEKVVLACLLHDIGVALSSRATDEILREVQGLSALSLIPYTALKHSSEPQSIRYRLSGLFARSEQ